jgi:hypothetical protein
VHTTEIFVRRDQHQPDQYVLFRMTAPAPSAIEVDVVYCLSK